MSVPFPNISQLGRIRTKDGWSYQITPDDVLWLARSSKFEGGSKPATLWTYAQRLANHRGSSLTNLVRAHSQPVNPIWASLTGAGCVAHPDKCTPEQLARRAQASTATWESLSTAPTVLAWAQAKLPNPAPRSTDFADQTVGASFVRRHTDSRIVLDAGNIYIAEGPSTAGSGGGAPTHWDPDYVTIAYAGHVAGPAASGGVGGVAGIVVLIAAWGLWKWLA